REMRGERLNHCLRIIHFTFTTHQCMYLFMIYMFDIKQLDELKYSLALASFEAVFGLDGFLQSWKSPNLVHQPLTIMKAQHSNLVKTLYLKNMKGWVHFDRYTIQT
ncbi:MAG: hypothetical protein ACRC6N_05350, partial [Plesiomonas sp.]|uniref:hypothetical protein n=1 Tax=Plesiomonas sp. TaxID=2486279 RepID=UPI003F315D48